MQPSRTDRARELFDTYTRDLSREDLRRLFTHDTPDAYRFFARGLNEDQFAGLPPWKRIPLRVRQLERGLRLVGASPASAGSNMEAVHAIFQVGRGVRSPAAARALAGPRAGTNARARA